VETARDRALSINEGPIWFVGLIEILAQLETGWGN
jgi:hypothetical protein